MQRLLLSLAPMATTAARMAVMAGTAFGEADAAMTSYLMTEVPRPVVQPNARAKQAMPLVQAMEEVKIAAQRLWIAGRAVLCWFVMRAVQLSWFGMSEAMAVRVKQNDELLHLSCPFS